MAVRNEDAIQGATTALRYAANPAELPEGTLVAIRCTDMPPGIGEKDHAAGLASSMHNLAAFVEGSGEAAAAPLISPSPPPPLRPGPPDRPTCRSP